MDLLLSPDAISHALNKEASVARAVDLMTYNFTAGNEAYLRIMKDLRLIVGVSPEDERSSRAEARLQAFANVCRLLGIKHQVRLLPKSHVKLAVFHTTKARGYLRAILTTMNGVAPKEFKEIGVLITGNLAARLERYFMDRWMEATPVNPLDLSAVKKVLESSVFEVKETT